MNTDHRTGCAERPIARGPRLFRRLAAWLLVYGLMPATAWGGRIEAELSDMETQLNVPVIMQITLYDTNEEPQPPQLPTLTDATIQLAAGPSSSQNMTIINGRVTQSKSTQYSLRIIPRKLGTLTIPPITLAADGQNYSTPAQTIIVNKAESGDLLFVEIKSNRTSIYLGEQLDVTLQIWLKPFVDRATRHKMPGDRLFRCIAFDNSQWGDFQSVLRSFSFRSQVRADARGQQGEYYLYEVHRQIWPEKSGQYDPGTVSVVVNYPTRLGRAQDMFSVFNRDQYSVAAQKTLSATATIEPVEIRPLPVEGQPAWFRGAVGPHDFSVTAKPTDVAVGDPITLTLTITPRGSAKLEWVQCSSLTDIPELVAGFKVPADPLAGVVTGNSKQFTQSIRALSDQVAEVPALPFTWFDPDKARYMTTYSQPIALKVKPTEAVTMSQIVESGGSRAAPTMLTERTSGILANYLDVEQLISHDDVVPGWPTAILLGLPPLLFAAFSVTHRRRMRLRGDTAYARQRTAARNALRQIGAAGGGSNNAAITIGAALRDYVADRCNLPAGALTVEEAVMGLRARGLRAELAEQVEALLRDCEIQQYTRAADPSTAGDLSRRAAELVQAIERERLT